MNPITFFVSGTAKPAGSKRGFYIPKLKRVVITDACKESRDWKTDVKHEAQAAYSGPLLEGPLSVTLTFLVLRPKGHFRTGKNKHLLRDSAPMLPTSKPDVLKLARGVEDALTGVLYKDDAQIVVEVLRKVYDVKPGAHVSVSEVTK